ncbi:ABC transporter permease subunit, partial [Cronobacter sakazakii]|uniref:ABC transporter permease subunit n=1 Tax=Cronobacter sakazakii TaxID=28141 RepID=UPI001CECEEB3
AHPFGAGGAHIVFAQHIHERGAGKARHDRRHGRAKGVSEKWVILKHGLRNAMIPVVTMMGLQFGFLLGGSIVVEKVFNWPGLGRLLVDSVEMRDYPVIQAEVLLFSLEFILINLVVDVLYAAINPAIRYK